MTTLRRERRLKFEEEIKSSQLHYYARLLLEHNGNTPEYVENTLKKCREDLALILAVSAESRTELKTDELQGIYEAADKTVDTILQFEKQAQQAESEGKAWRGREFLVGSDYCKYGDWYHAKTGWQMYGAKSKPKQDSTVMAEFKKWWENDITTTTLDQAYQIENDWRKGKSGLDQNITHPRELTAKAIAIQAAGVVKNTTVDTKEKGGFYG